MWLLGSLSLPIYLLALPIGPFRVRDIVPYFWLFGAAFGLYSLATWIVLRTNFTGSRTLAAIFGFALLFNVALLPARPGLSDDMYRYIWDGRVQASGINPYRYPSNAFALRDLRDDAIWRRMNRIDAVTIYPPGAQAVFAVLWRLVGDSVIGFKAFMALCALIAGWLLVGLLRTFGERPERVLIFLWSPLVIFEVAESGHVDALCLPLILGAMLSRATMPGDRVSVRREALIGFLLGTATLVKLYPAMVFIPLWSVRDAYGCRRWRLALPIMMLATIAVGYALYIAPDVDTLGFLPTYSREFFNIGPLPLALIRWAQANGIDFWRPVTILMPMLVVIASLWFVFRPALCPRQAVMRCMVPISIYLLVSQNLFSWYVLWILPLIALDLKPGSSFGWTLNPAFAWWIFSGLVSLSYTIFITGWTQDWAINAQFIPLYALLATAFVNRVSRIARPNIVEVSP